MRLKLLFKATEASSRLRNNNPCQEANNFLHSETQELWKSIENLKLSISQIQTPHNYIPPEQIS